LTETDLLVAVLELAKFRQCYVHHCRPALSLGGRWHTPIQGDAGFVDLVIATRSRVLWRELKGARGRVTPEQRLWIGRLQTAGQDVAVWKPADLESGLIDEELRA
jgi:hypothetical protein